MSAGKLSMLVLAIPILIYLSGRLILAPLKNAALTPRPRVQFRMTEILLLMAQIGAISALFASGLNTAKDLVLLIVTTLFLPMCWLFGVRWLGHAGVTDPAARLWTLGVAVPLAFGGIPVPLTFGGIPMLLLGPVLWPVNSPSHGSVQILFYVGLVWILCLLVGHIVLCRWIVRRALQTRESGAAT